jgi:hypothetical protein
MHLHLGITTSAFVIISGDADALVFRIGLRTGRQIDDLHRRIPAGRFFVRARAAFWRAASIDKAIIFSYLVWLLYRGVELAWKLLGGKSCFPKMVLSEVPFCSLLV